MAGYGDIERVLNYAIAREAEAHDFYSELAGWVEKPEMCEVLRGLAAEEMAHKEMLEAAKAGRLELGDEEVGALGIAEEMEDVKPEAGMEYVDALVLAMKKEKQAFRLYTRLAEMAKSDDVRAMFTRLAQEEAHHKLRFEVEYDLATF